MKKNYQIISLSLLITLLFFLPGVINAQNANREDGSDRLYYQWYVNLNGGITQSYGDILSGSWHGNMLGSDDIKFGFGARLGKHISPVFGLYGSYINASLQGISGKDTKNMNFNTDINDFILGTTFSFSNLFFGYKPRLINVYGTTGIGLVNFDAYAYNNDANNTPADDGQNGGNGYPGTTETMIPTGAGIDIRLNNRWDINLESTIRWFDSDKLDGFVSGSKGDAYFFTSLGVGYSFWRPSSGSKMQIETEPSVLAIHGDSIPIEIKGTFPGSYDKRAVVDFSPVLKYGTQTKQLETMYFQGADVAEEYQKAGAAIMPETGGSFTYKTYVKYEPGMDICELYVEPMSSIKGRTPGSMGDRKIADGLIMTSKRLNNSEVVLVAPHNFTPNVIQTQTGTMFFVVNRSDYNTSFTLNKTDEAKTSMSGMNDFINKGWEIKSIDIDAWASPEGEESFNQGLSKRRAETGQKYTEKAYAKYVKTEAKKLGVTEDKVKQDVKFNVSPNGEDWDGFMQALQKSNIKDKNIIANVVNSQSDLAKREQEIRNMTVIYKEIEDELLPPLRRTVIKVNCYEPSLSDSEIAEYATSAPDSLTANELLYAGTLTEDLNAKLNIYKTAIKQFPNDWRGYNNAGETSIAMDDYDDAAGFFNKAKSLAAENGIVLNNLGTIAAKNKDYKTARTDYMAAQKQGVDVSYNMGIVKIAEGNYNGAINSFSGKKCDYNLALAHTLSGNYNAASSTLNCAEKTAEVYYLQAVIGARTDNDKMVFDNLKNAIKEDKSYINTAKEDKEFMKYYSNPEFLNIFK